MAYEPTHDVPASGLPAFAEPDAAPGPAAQLVPGLDVQVLERRDDWAYIECSNGWKAWVNGTLLVVRAVAPPPPAPERTPPPPPPSPEPAPPPVAAPAPPPPTPTASEPSGAWAAPSAPGAAGTRGGLALGPGHLVALVGAGIFLVSAWLNWIGFDIAGFSDSFSAYRVPANFLRDSTAGDAGLNLGLFMWILTILGVGAILASATNASLRWLPVAYGGLITVVTLLFIWQATNLADQFEAFGGDVGTFDLIEIGVYVGLVGAIIALVGGVLVLTRKS